jgi:urease accessory protein
MIVVAKPVPRVSSLHELFRNPPGEAGVLNGVTENGCASPVEKGFGHLEVQMVSGMSAATSVCASSPLKILVPRPRGESVWAYLSSFGGGMVAGDETKLTVKLGAGTRCFLSTQASTKVYRNPKNRPCGHELRADLAEDSLLVLAPDAVQAFADSDYVQCQEFHLARGSGVVLVDWLGSGRAACGERWAFNRFQSRNEIFLEGERIFLDALSLDAEPGPLGGAHRMGRMNCIATIVILGEVLNTVAAQVLERIASRPIERRASLLCSASAIKGGVVLRLAGEAVEQVRREIHQQLDFLRDVLHDDPWARKW